MLLAALAACVTLAVHGGGGEWVEISQQYHRPRKPTRYFNTTVTEHGWSQTSNKNDTGGDIERWSRKPDDIDISGERKPSENLGDKRITVAPLNPEGSKTEVPITFVKDSLGPTRAIIEKVSNVGSVKRVQLSNTPIKSPTISISDVSIRKPEPDNTQDSDEFVINANIFKDEEVMSVAPVPNREQDYNKGSPDTNPYNSQSNYNISKEIEPKLDPSLNRRVDTKENNIKMNSNITATINSNEEKVKKVENQITNTVKNNIHRPNKHSLNDQNEHQYSIESNHDTRYPDDKTSTQNDQSNEFKINTMDNILKFMKVVTETISKNVRRGVNGKVKYLSELKDSMLQNIKYRIDACWPDDIDSPTVRERKRRRSRAAAIDTARGHVEFPSSDSALMTISFLTFAVFLIKLVLQVIQAYKNKAMIMAPVMVATAGRRRLATKEGKH